MSRACMLMRRVAARALSALTLCVCFMLCCYFRMCLITHAPEGRTKLAHAVCHAMVDDATLIAAKAHEEESWPTRRKWRRAGRHVANLPHSADMKPRNDRARGPKHRPATCAVVCISWIYTGRWATRTATSSQRLYRFRRSSMCAHPQDYAERAGGNIKGERDTHIPLRPFGDD